MVVNFDEERWSQLDEHLKVAQLCGEGAGRLYGPAKGVVQRVVATIGTDKDVTPAEAEHALAALHALRDSTAHAAQAFAAAVARIDELMRPLESPAPKPKAPRSPRA